MDHLLHYIKKEVAYTSASGTIYLDLPKDANISMLMIETRLTRDTTRDADMAILQAITKINVLLDGAKIAYSMQPEVGSFDYLLRAGKNPPHRLTTLKSDNEYMRLPILFGRYPYDLEYGLNTARYGSAAVEIEYAPDTTAYDETSLVLTAWIAVPVIPVSYKGFVRARIIEDKATPTASSIHTTDFPSTYPLLAAFVRIFDMDQWMKTNVTDLDFQADQGRVRIFDGRIEDLLSLNDTILGHRIASPQFVGTARSSEELITYMGEAFSGFVVWFAGSPVDVGFASFSGHTVLFVCETTGSDISIEYQVFGQGPFGCLILGDWRHAPFNAPAHADLKCDYTIGATTPEFLTTCVLEVVDGVL